MAHEPILGAAGPWLHPLGATESEASDLLAAFAKADAVRVAARRIRGAKARTTQGWFDECAAVLQFPWYFGENWNAFDECITDLEWLPADAYVLLVTNGCRLLDGEPPENLTVLLSALARAGREWSRPDAGQFPRRPKAFHVLVQCEPADEDRLREKMDAAKATWSPYRRP